MAIRPRPLSAGTCSLGLARCLAGSIPPCSIVSAVDRPHRRADRRSARARDREWRGVPLWRGTHLARAPVGVQDVSRSSRPSRLRDDKPRGSRANFSALRRHSLGLARFRATLSVSRSLARHESADERGVRPPGGVRASRTAARSSWGRSAGPSGVGRASCEEDRGQGAGSWAPSQRGGAFGGRSTEAFLPQDL